MAAAQARHGSIADCFVAIGRIRMDRGKFRAAAAAFRKALAIRTSLYGAAAAGHEAVRECTRLLDDAEMATALPEY